MINGRRRTFSRSRSFFMSNGSEFQIVCTNCGCLSIKIEEPLKSSREAIVHCGDCGTARGTVGALRDLSVQHCPSIDFSTPASALSTNTQMADAQPTTRISAQYAELQRLRQQVKVAEWLASGSDKPWLSGRIRKSSSRPFAFHRTYFGDERNQKRPS
jgi:hypothetical protein